MPSHNHVEDSTERGLGDVYHAVDNYIDHEVEEAKKASRAFRRAWVPVIKASLSSAADVVGDWVFYYRTKNADDGYGLDEFERPLYFFCMVSSVLCVLAVLTQFLNNCSCFKNVNDSGYKKKCMNRINWVLGMEMFFEDIPQLMLTTAVLYTKRGGYWTGVAVFNVTTSAFNFTFNILDMLMPLEEVHHETDKSE